MISTYPLASLLARELQFNQVAEGTSGGVEYWTGVALLNALDKVVEVQVDILRPDGNLDRTKQVTLRPYEEKTALLSQFLEEPGYRRLDGYIRVRASDPITGIVFYGDTRNQSLAAVPGLPR